MGAETEATQTEKDRKALAWRHAWRIGTRRRGYGGSTRFRTVAPYRWATGRGGMFFAWGMHQRLLMGLVVTALAAMLVSSCGGGGEAKKMIPLQIRPLPEEVASKHPRPISTRR